MSKEMAKAHEADKANRKTKKAKKSKPAQESAAPIEIEDESWLDNKVSFYHELFLLNIDWLKYPDLFLPIFPYSLSVLKLTQ